MGSSLNTQPILTLVILELYSEGFYFGDDLSWIKKHG
jgi:hypothetical protein